VENTNLSVENFGKAVETVWKMWGKKTEKLKIVSSQVKVEKVRDC
jgi:hypothetical protein